ncbi:MAG: hypothetical protein DRJ26_05270 [Candidatus Methanomethylicota archaeon]|uniref:Uncharacterized protein n=1 Tax=Thermoproteota archaeon TaxID=2056631 RepID=A0A497EX29_9CREN|nr:MAG: hypothetical protein DRJ26_05270 [Candidatus Verstraetearchaeota archaeon]
MRTCFLPHFSVGLDPLAGWISEARNIKILNKFEALMTKIPNIVWRIGAFEFRICFGFRYSDLGFKVKPSTKVGSQNPMEV